MLRESMKMFFSVATNEDFRLRKLYIRAFLINQGISHNRIIIEINEEKITKQWKNEVILKFIEV